MRKILFNIEINFKKKKKIKKKSISINLYQKKKKGKENLKKKFVKFGGRITVQDGRLTNLRLAKSI